MAQILGLDAVIIDLSHAAATIDDKAEEVVEKHTKATAETYESLVSRDEGHVARLVDYDVTRTPGKTTGEAGSYAWDAHFREYGTATMGPAPAAGPALDRHSGDFEKDLGDAAEF